MTAVPSRPPHGPGVAVSVITALHNRLDLTQPYLRSVEQTLNERDAEIVLIDDVSSDGTREMLARLPARYRVLLNERRGSYAINNNRAASVGGYKPTMCLPHNAVQIAAR